MATQQPQVLGRALLTPAVALLFIWMIVPLAMTIYFSTLHYSLLDAETWSFVGLENFRYFLTDPAFLTALRNTLVLVGPVLAITILLGTPLAVPRPADHRGHPDRTDLPADRVRRDLCHDRRRPRPGDHQYRVPDLLAGAGPVRRRQRLGRRTGRGRDRQYRGLLPGADRRAESGGVSDGTQGDGKTRMGVHGCRVVVRISDLPAHPVDGANELQDRARGVLHAAKIPVVSLDDRELRHGEGAQ